MVANSARHCRSQASRRDAGDYPDRSTTLRCRSTVWRRRRVGLRVRVSAICAPRPRRYPPTSSVNSSSIAPNFPVGSISFLPPAVPLRRCRAACVWRGRLMYVAAKVARRPLAASHQLWRARGAATKIYPDCRRSDREQLALAVDRVMCRARSMTAIWRLSPSSRRAGDLIEAIFLLRAYRATLPRLVLCRAGRYRPPCACADASRQPTRICPGPDARGPRSTTRIALLDPSQRRPRHRPRRVGGARRRRRRRR